MRHAILFLALLALAACGDESGRDRAGSADHADHTEHAEHADHGEHSEGDSPDEGDATDDDAEGHRHEAPHGGTLIELGEHFAHLEVKLDAATGRLDVWILDKEADKTIRLKVPSIPMAVDAIESTLSRASFAVILDAQASELTGEKVGDTARFGATVEDLVGVESFVARIPMLTVLGRSFPTVEIRYPDGNE